MRSAKAGGVQPRNTLTIQQAQALLAATDCGALEGLRDRALLSVLMGCGLQKSEAAELTFRHLQQRNCRWCLVNLVSKDDHVRTVPLPAWVKAAIDAWTDPAGLTTGSLFPVVSPGGEVEYSALSARAVSQLVRRYAEVVGLPGIAPHDLRRSFANWCRAAGGELEQIQLLLGHSPVHTTEHYLGTKQDLVHAPNDAIGLDIV